MLFVSDKRVVSADIKFLSSLVKYRLLYKLKQDLPLLQ